MKAAIRSRGNIIFSNDYQKPTCDPKHILIRVKAAAINPIDYKLPWPAAGTVVGIDFSGIVEEKGANVTENFNVGDEVYGSAGRNGSLAEFVLVDPKTIALKPKNASFVEAASMNVTYITALQGLRKYGKMQEGDRVLIIAASGGTGTAAVQLAKILGAKEIVGVCSGKNAEFVKSLGATDIVDYTKQTVKEFCLNGGSEVTEDQKFDVVFDAATNSGAGEDYKDQSLELLKTGQRHGQYVAINGSAGMWLRYFTIGFKANQNMLVADSNTEDLDYLAKLVDENGMKPIIAEDLPFNAENLEKGFSLLKSRRMVGKVVFNMADV